VERFVKLGGYRIYPSEISYDSILVDGDKLKIAHAWKNLGVGVMPNNNSRWNFKYKVAFGIINSNNELKKVHYSEDVEPSEWIDGEKFEYEEWLDLSGVSAGEYKLVCAIVDSKKEHLPAINLAVRNKSLLNEDGWLMVGDFKL